MPKSCMFSHIFKNPDVSLQRKKGVSGEMLRAGTDNENSRGTSTPNLTSFIMSIYSLRSLPSPSPRVFRAYFVLTISPLHMYKLLLPFPNSPESPFKQKSGPHLSLEKPFFPPIYRFLWLRLLSPC